MGDILFGEPPTQTTHTQPPLRPPLYDWAFSAGHQWLPPLMGGRYPTYPHNIDPGLSPSMQGAMRMAQGRSISPTPDILGQAAGQLGQFMRGGGIPNLGSTAGASNYFPLPQPASQPRYPGSFSPWDNQQGQQAQFPQIANTPGFGGGPGQGGGLQSAPPQSLGPPPSGGIYGGYPPAGGGPMRPSSGGGYTNRPYQGMPITQFLPGGMMNPIANTPGVGGGPAQGGGMGNNRGRLSLPDPQGPINPDVLPGSGSRPTIQSGPVGQFPQIGGGRPTPFTPTGPLSRQDRFQMMRDMGIERPRQFRRMPLEDRRRMRDEWVSKNRPGMARPTRPPVLSEPGGSVKPPQTKPPVLQEPGGKPPKGGLPSGGIFAGHDTSMGRAGGSPQMLPTAIGRTGGGSMPMPGGPSGPIFGGRPPQQTPPVGPASIYDVYRAAIPIMNMDRDQQISQSLAQGGMSGNRFSTTSENNVARIGADTALRQNQLMMDLLYSQGEADQGRALQAALAAPGIASTFDSMGRNRMRDLFDFARYEQDRADRLQMIPYQDYLQGRLGYNPQILQLLGSVGGSTGSQPPPITTTSGGGPGLIDAIIPFLPFFPGYGGTP